jgi:hypothetical protein
MKVPLGMSPRLLSIVRNNVLGNVIPSFSVLNYNVFLANRSDLRFKQYIRHTAYPTNTRKLDIIFKPLHKIQTSSHIFVHFASPF